MVYPNPSSDFINLQFSKTENRNIQVFDINGRLVSESESDQTLVSIDARNLIQGVYTVKVNEKNNSFQINRFVKL